MFRVMGMSSVHVQSPTMLCEIFRCSLGGGMLKHIIKIKGEITDHTAPITKKAQHCLGRSIPCANLGRLE